MDRLHQMALHLFVHDPPPSRNRHYAAYEDARFKEAFALNRRLRALLAALRRARAQGGRLVVTHGERRGAPAVRLLLESPRAKQASVLTLAAWNVFLAHEGAADCVAALTA